LPTAYGADEFVPLSRYGEWRAARALPERPHRNGWFGMDKHFAGYDDIVRVPLVMRFPGRIRAGRVYDGFVSHSIDLASTICAAADEAIPDSFMGRNLLDVTNGRGPAPRQDIFSMYQGCQMGLWSTRMIRDARYKLVYHATAEAELYDLATDPGELRNVVRDPALDDELRRLSRRLLAWMTAIGDPLLNEWTRRHITDIRAAQKL